MQPDRDITEALRWVGGRPGVIGARSGHLTPEQEQGRGASLDDLSSTLGSTMQRRWDLLNGLRRP